MSNAENRARAQLRERNAGLLLIAAAALAILLANSPLAPAYEGLLHLKLGPPMPRLGRFDLHLWIADALMAVFFLLVGLEVKREWFEGRLADPARRRLPILAAAGGMAVPALVYLAVIGGDPAYAHGWAIPAATDIAFAICILALLGSRAPAAIKVLLVTIAIVDDIGAVIIIALFYTASLNVTALFGALVVTASMALLAMVGVKRLAPYLALFVLLWFLVLASGIHATIAGVLAALTIPLKGDATRESPLKRLEHAIHGWVMFLIVPLFGFASAGVHLGGGSALLAHPIALGVMLGLLIGKPLGVFGTIWLADRTGLAPAPEGLGRRALAGAAVLTGIGFTMSLFIGALAFPADPEAIDRARLGTLAGSLLAALAGFALLRFATPATDADLDLAEEDALFTDDADDVAS